MFVWPGSHDERRLVQAANMECFITLKQFSVHFGVSLAAVCG